MTMTYRHLAKVTVSEEAINEAIRRQRAIVGSRGGSFDELSRELSRGVVFGTGVSVNDLTTRVVNAHTLSATIVRVAELLTEPDEADYVLAPTSVVLTQMLSLLGPAVKKLTRILPRPLISPDGSGGIRFEWRAGNKDLRLIFRVSALPYIYHQVGDEYEIEENPNQDQTALWLDWLST